MKRDEVSFVAKISDCDFSFKPKYSYPEKESNEDVKPYLKSIIYRNLIRKDDDLDIKNYEVFTVKKTMNIIPLMKILKHFTTINNTT